MLLIFENKKLLAMHTFVKYLSFLPQESWRKNQNVVVIK